METFNKNMLEKLGIYELRLIARNKGITSSSLLRKKELIEKILLTGENNKVITSGRPSLYDNVKIIHNDMFDYDICYKNVNEKLIKELTKNFVDFVAKTLNFDKDNKYTQFIKFLSSLND